MLRNDYENKGDQLGRYSNHCHWGRWWLGPGEEQCGDSGPLCRLSELGSAHLATFARAVMGKAPLECLAHSCRQLSCTKMVDGPEAEILLCSRFYACVWHRAATQ